MQSLRRKWQSPAARGGADHGPGHLRAAVVHHHPELSVRAILLAVQGLQPDAFRFIFADSDFYKALKSGFIPAFGLAAIAIPLGGMLAFLMIRTDLPGRRWIEPLILVPIFVSPMVLGFGYVVAAGPVGFFSTWAQSLLGFVP